MIRGITRQRIRNGSYLTARASRRVQRVRARSRARVRSSCTSIVPRHSAAARRMRGAMLNTLDLGQGGASSHLGPGSRAAAALPSLSLAPFVYEATLLPAWRWTPTPASERMRQSLRVNFAADAFTPRLLFRASCAQCDWLSQSLRTHYSAMAARSKAAGHCQEIP